MEQYRTCSSEACWTIKIGRFELVPSTCREGIDHRTMASASAPKAISKRSLIQGSFAKGHVWNVQSLDNSDLGRVVRSLACLVCCYI